MKGFILVSFFKYSKNVEFELGWFDVISTAAIFRFFLCRLPQVWSCWNVSAGLKTRVGTVREYKSPSLDMPLLYCRIILTKNVELKK